MYFKPFPPEEGKELVGLVDTDYKHVEQFQETQDQTDSNHDRRQPSRVVRLLIFSTPFSGY